MNKTTIRIFAVKCGKCGRYISYNDCDTGKAVFHFTPDSAFAVEDEWWECPKCAEKK